MDKLLSWTAICVFALCLVIGGNYLLTDDAGNFNTDRLVNLFDSKKIVELQAKAKEFKENILSEFLKRDPTPAEQVAEVLVKRDSVFSDYIAEYRRLSSGDLTTFQIEKQLEDFQSKYLNEQFNWTGSVKEAKKYGSYLLLYLRPIPNVKYITLFCQMKPTELNLKHLFMLKKGDKITVTGIYSKNSDEDVWLKDCKIVDK